MIGYLQFILGLLPYHPGKQLSFSKRNWQNT